VHERDGIELTGLQLRLDLFRQDWLAPLDLERLGLLAATLADVEPLIGELRHRNSSTLPGDEIAYGSFHHAPR